MAKKRKLRTPEEKTALVNQVKQAVAGGTPMADALKTAGISENNYYAWRSAGKRGRRKALKVEHIAVPLEPANPRDELAEIFEDYIHATDKALTRALRLAARAIQ